MTGFSLIPHSKVVIPLSTFVKRLDFGFEHLYVGVETDLLLKNMIEFLFRISELDFRKKTMQNE